MDQTEMERVALPRAVLRGARRDAFEHVGAGPDGFVRRHMLHATEPDNFMYSRHLQFGPCGTKGKSP